MWVSRESIFAHFHLIVKLPNTEKAVHIGAKRQMACLPLGSTWPMCVHECKCGRPAHSAHEEAAHPDGEACEVCYSQVREAPALQ